MVGTNCPLNLGSRRSERARVEILIKRADPNFALRASYVDDGVKIATKIFGKDGTTVISSQTVIIKPFETARMDIGDTDNGNVANRIFLQVQHLRDPGNVDRSTVKVLVPFRNPTPIKDTIKRMAQLTKKNIVLPRDLTGSIRIDTAHEELEIDRVVSEYRLALARNGLDLIEVDDRVLKIGRLDGERQ